MSAYLWRPVIAGLWRQHETSDGTYSFLDLWEVNRALDVQQENQRRAAEAHRNRK